MVFVKKSTFLLCVSFGAIKASKKHSLIFWIENNAFWTSKVKFSQSRKKPTFCKGVSPWFLSKNQPFSHMFFLGKKKQKKTFFYILDRKECFLDYKREVLKNFHKSTFWKRVSPWFFLKNGRFPNLFFWAKKARKKRFFYILGSKEWFLDLKSEVLAK